MINLNNKQILVIHGGDAFETYEEYLEYLRTRDFSLDRLKTKGWKSNLGEQLGDEYEVLTPQMPNSQNARYSEWKIWFARLIPLLNEEVILIGHSLGGIFLAKYLSENDFPKKIIAVLLVAAPFNTPIKHPLVDFNLINDLAKFQEQAGKIFLYHSKDDQVVPFSNLEDYKKALPSATLRIFEDNQHFNQEQFPEIIGDIKKLLGE